MSYLASRSSDSILSNKLKFIACTSGLNPYTWRTTDFKTPIQAGQISTNMFDVNYIKTARDDPKYMVAVMATGGTGGNPCRHSINGGTTWVTPSVSSATYSNECDISPNGQYMVINRYHTGGIIWSTVNYGTNWTMWSFGARWVKPLVINNTGEVWLFHYLTETTGERKTISAMSSAAVATITQPFLIYGSCISKDGTVWVAETGNANSRRVAKMTSPTTWSTIVVESGTGLGSGNSAICCSDNGKHILYTPNDDPYNDYFVSNDYGVTWNKKSVIGPATIYGADGYVSKTGRYMALSGSLILNIWVSTDFGNTWGNYPAIASGVLGASAFGLYE